LPSREKDLATARRPLRKKERKKKVALAL